MSDSVSKTASQTEGGGQIPAKIGRYDIVERLGSGSTGTVYRATDPFIGRLLAIKTFRIDLKPGPERDRFLQRFYHEARISGGLSHPNIVALFDVGEVEGLPYLVFEHVDGPSLDVALARSGRLDPAETIRVVEHTAGALDFAHARGVVHRDIRPANIMLATDQRVRIADFGIARVEGSHLTQHGEVLGTPAYMSPEQIRGHDLSPSSDLFSLAVCAYEMLSGQRPFVGKDQSEMLEALVYSPPTEPKELRSLGIPSRDFMFVFERALAKDPAHRFADAASFARALKSCLGVAVAGDESRPVTRIAIPEVSAPPKRAILPPVAPPAPPTVQPLPPPAPDSSADATIISPKHQTEVPAPPSPPPASFDTAATAAIDASASGLGSLVAEAEPEGVPQGSSADATLVSNVASDRTLSAPVPSTSAEATMLSPVSDSGSAPPRLSREAVESLVASPGHGKPAPVLQKTLPGSEQTLLGSSTSGVDEIPPPTRDTPMLEVSPPLSASGPDRAAIGSSFAATLVDSNQSGGASPVFVNPGEATVIMSEAERLRAAKLRVSDRSAVENPFGPPPITRTPPTPSMSQTGATYRSAISRPPHRPPTVPPPAVEPTLEPPRPSLLPKIVAVGFFLLVLLGVAVGAILWGRSGTPTPQAVERWNNLVVYQEADVDKSPQPLSIEIPRPTLEPGRVVSITVSWIVTTAGDVADPRVEESASPEIDAFVVAGIRRWRYEPAVKDGRTAPVRVVRKYTFPPRGSSQGS